MTLFAFAVLVAAAFVKPPDPKLFEPAAYWLSRVFLLPFVVAWIAPLIPLFVAIVRYFLTRPAPPWLAWTLAILALFGGLILTFLGLVVTPGNSILIMGIHGLALTLAVVSSLPWLAFGRIDRIGVRITLITMLVAAVPAIWSLLSVPIVLIQASRAAEGAPFCITEHKPFSKSDGDPHWDLRAFSMYTMRSGYKDNSTWYFHGILVVDSGNGLRYFNWSPRRLRFDLIKYPRSFTASIEAFCQPS